MTQICELRISGVFEKISEKLYGPRIHIKHLHQELHTSCNISVKEPSPKVYFGCHVEYTHGNGSLLCGSCRELDKSRKAFLDHLNKN